MQVGFTTYDYLVSTCYSIMLCSQAKRTPVQTPFLHLPVIFVFFAAIFCKMTQHRCASLDIVAEVHRSSLPRAALLLTHHRSVVQMIHLFRALSLSGTSHPAAPSAVTKRDTLMMAPVLLLLLVSQRTKTTRRSSEIRSLLYGYVFCKGSVGVRLKIST